jgi:CubicO group peptidase (beta-lactamase class C family)/predicted secreted protein
MEHTIRLKRKRIDPGIIAGVLVLGIVAVLVAFYVIPWRREARRPVPPPYWPTTGWQTSLPEAQGLYSDKLAELMLFIREENIPVHNLLAIRNGYVVADATFYPYDGQTIHDVASVTKSVMTTLIGIAVDQGKLELDDKMVSFFPGRTIANLDPRKEAITVRHLASMTSGLQCNRDGTEGDSAIAMQSSPDYVQFALDLPVAWEPGSHFVYCSPAIHLLSPILQQATGMTTLAFAQQYLFGPLNIGDVLWETDPQGYYRGWGDLSLHPHDMAKIGFLFLQQGQWEGEQIVSREWVKEATIAQSETPEDEDPYGYGWWLTPDIETVYRADGRNGQYIYILPIYNMILVTTGGGYEIAQIGEPLLATFSDFAEPLPANPEGVAQLEAAIAAVAQPPAANPAAPLPDVARAVSGQTYVFESNLVGLESVAFNFGSPAEATGHMKVAGEPIIAMPIGLDGAYRFRFDDVGRLVAIRGTWTDAQTFVLEHNSVTANDQLVLQFYFQGDQIEVTVSDAYFGSGPKFKGRLQQPTAEIALDMNADGSQVTMESGQALVIRLESNPTTGYSWAVQEIDTAVLRQIGDVEYEPADTGLVGSGGWESCRFEAVAAGQTTLELVYRRPWEEDIPPDETFILDIIVR